MAEPVTALTDYILAGLYLLFAGRLFRRGQARNQVSIRLAAASFVASAATAFVGGTYHWVPNDVLWKVTVYCAGLVSFFLIAVAAYAGLKTWLRCMLLAGAAVELAVYTAWVSRHDEFRYVICNYVVAMIVLLAVSVGSARLRTSGSALWIMAAILVTFAGSAAQYSHLAIHRYFNHNDLYHVIQMGAVWLFYRGFQGYEDRA